MPGAAVAAAFITDALHISFVMFALFCSFARAFHGSDKSAWVSLWGNRRFRGAAVSTVGSRLGRACSSSGAARQEAKLTRAGQQGPGLPGGHRKGLPGTGAGALARPEQRPGGD